MLHRIDKPEEEVEIIVYLAVFTVESHEAAAMTNGCRA